MLRAEVVGANCLLGTLAIEREGLQKGICEITIAHSCFYSKKSVVTDALNDVEYMVLSESIINTLHLYLVARLFSWYGRRDS